MRKTRYSEVLKKGAAIVDAERRAKVVESVKKDLLALMDPKLMSNWDHVGRGIATRLQNAVADGKVKSFSELHDYMDANMLGHQVEMFEEYVRADMYDRGVDLLNAAQTEVGEWVAKGGLQTKQNVIQ